MAYQYLIPLVDMGVVIVARAPEITHAYGRVQLLAPGKPCFTCSGLLNPEQVRRDMLSEVERKADPYIVGQAEPAPAVMSINGTVASLSVTMALAVMADVPSKGRHLLYNALASTLRSVGGIPDPHCYICSQEGALARAKLLAALCSGDSAVTIQVIPMLARKQVAWCKSTPPAEAVDAFTRRGYKVLPSISYAKLRSQADMSGVGAVVFTQSQVKPSLISRELNDHVRRLLDLDCRVIVLPLRVGDRGIPNVVNALVPMVLPATNQQGNPPLPYASIYEPTVGWEEIANFVVEAPPGPPPNLGLNIEFEGKAETKDAILLLRRAFADCVNVHLSRLHEGKSRDVRVYKACVELINGAVGCWPHPYFVKIGPRATIYGEFENYVLYVDPYIPFHLGPRVIDIAAVLARPKVSSSVIT